MSPLHAGTRRDRRFPVAACLTLLVLAGMGCHAGLTPGANARPAKEEKSDRPEDADKPKIQLKTDPAVGFTPVTATVTGLVSGIRRDDPNYCHAAVTWVLLWPGQREEDAQKVREDPACLHAEEEISVDLAYTKVFDLVRPGSYLVRLEIEGKDHSRVRSGFTKIQVLRVQ